MDYISYQEELKNIRRFLHMHPETAFEEFETTKYIKEYLENIGYEVTMYEPTGCSALLIKDESYKTVVIRAEMDAVPIKERAEIEYASLNEGKMHACGHDANMAVLLVLAKVFKQNSDNLKCNIRFLFEPAEEAGRGSYQMIKQGVLENPKADYFIMFHFGNKDTYGMEVNHYSASAAVGRFEIDIHGNAVHWCVRERGKDALNAGAKATVMLNNLNEEVKLDNPFVIGVSMLNSGVSANTMAESASIKGGIRTYTIKEYHQLADIVEEKLKKLSEETGMEFDINISREPIPPIVNDKDMVEIADRLGEEIFKEEFFPIDYLFLAGDNASAYFNHTKGIFLVFRALHVDKRYSLHNSRFILDDSRLYKTLEMLHRYILELK